VGDHGGVPVDPGVYLHALLPPGGERVVVAAAGSIWFTLASRRATLRQIQTSLGQISEQLKQMAPTP
jgi:hypothetical protein